MATNYSHLDDKELMSLYIDGDSRAFEQLYARHNSKVYSYLNKRIKNKDSIEDIFQNIFIKFHKVRLKYDSQYEVLQWLYTISRNEMLDNAKKKSITTIEITSEHSEQTSNPVELPFEIDDEKILSDKEKAVLKLKYISDKDYEEISEILDSKVASIRKISSRAIKKLKEKYKR